VTTRQPNAITRQRKRLGRLLVKIHQHVT
jgi:hypothetical protein